VNLLATITRDAIDAAMKPPGGEGSGYE